MGPVSPPHRWDSSESAAQTSVQMDQGRAPRTLRGLGMSAAWHRPKAKSGGNGNDDRGAQVSLYSEVRLHAVTSLCHIRNQRRKKEQLLLLLSACPR